MFDRFHWNPKLLREQIDIFHLESITRRYRTRSFLFSQNQFRGWAEGSLQGSVIRSRACVEREENSFSNWFCHLFPVVFSKTTTSSIWIPCENGNTSQFPFAAWSFLLNPLEGETFYLKWWRDLSSWLTQWGSSGKAVFISCPSFSKADRVCGLFSWVCSCNSLFTSDRLVRSLSLLNH